MKINCLGALKKSLVWQLVLPVPIALVLGVGALSFYVPSAVEENARAAAIQAANQTAKATEEIGAQIGGMQTVTDDTVKAIEEIRGVIGKMGEIATTIASAVEEQGAATQEIARNAQEAAKGTTEVSGNVSGVTEAATETGTASAQMLEAAGGLSEQSELLRTEVDKFLAEVRAV